MLILRRLLGLVFQEWKREQFSSLCFDEKLTDGSMLERPDKSVLYVEVCAYIEEVVDKIFPNSNLDLTRIFVKEHLQVRFSALIN